MDQIEEKRILFSLSAGVWFIWYHRLYVPNRCQIDVCSKEIK